MTPEKLESIKKVRIQKERILAYITEEPACCAELEDALGLPPNIVSGRLSDLQAEMAIVETAETREGHWKTPQTVYRATGERIPKRKVKKPVTVGDHGARKHASNSPSQLAPKEICAHYEGQKSDIAHPVTLQGTKCHEAFETGALDGLDDDELAMVNYCNAYLDHVLVDRSRWELQHEIKLQTHDPSCYGFGDLLAISNGGHIAHLFDPKFGFNKQQDAGVNVQGQAYVLGALLKFPDVEEVHVHFIYPRFEQVSYHRYTRADMDMIRLRISTIIARVEVATIQRKAERAGKRSNRTVERHADLMNCRFCANKFDCPALVSLALHVRHDLDPELPEIVNPADIVSCDDMGKALDVASLIESWARDVKAWAICRFNESGIEPTGYQARERAGRGEVVNTRQVLSLARQYGVPEENIERCITVSLPQLAKEARASAPHGEMTKAEKAFRAEAERKGWFRAGNTSTIFVREK